GRARSNRRWPWSRSVATRLGALAPDVDVIEIGRGEPQVKQSRQGIVSDDSEDPRRTAKLLRYVWALLGCLATTLIALPLLPDVALANIVMLFLLTGLLRSEEH